MVPKQITVVKESLKGFPMDSKHIVNLLPKIVPESLPDAIPGGLSEAIPLRLPKEIP